MLLSVRNRTVYETAGAGATSSARVSPVASRLLAVSPAPHGISTKYLLRCAVSPICCGGQSISTAPNSISCYRDGATRQQLNSFSSACLPLVPKCHGRLTARRFGLARSTLIRQSILFAQMTVFKKSRCLRLFRFRFTSGDKTTERIFAGKGILAAGGGRSRRSNVVVKAWVNVRRWPNPVRTSNRLGGPPSLRDALGIYLPVSALR